MLGRLESSERDGTTTCDHRFFGYFEDRFILAVRNGKPVMIQYFKSASSTAPVDMIVCDGL